MKIAILTSGILPVPAVQGGAVENLIDFYLAYNDNNHLHDITVYSCNHHDTKKHPALKSIVNHYYYVDTTSIIAKIRKRLYLRKAGGGELHHFSIEYFIEQVLKHLRKQSYDLILIENRPPFSLKVKKVSSAKIVYHIHNSKLTKGADYAEELYDAADLIICVSDFITKEVKSIVSNDKKCVTVHNGIDLNAFSPNRKCGICRKDIGLNEDDFVLLFSGRINREKGISELLDAILSIKEFGNIKLLVIGSSFYGGGCTEDHFINSLKEKTECISNRVFFTGFIPYDKMPDCLSIADVAVIPSIWDDPFPTTVLEAQAMGLPIITTRRGGIPEEVTKENAILLETDEHFVDNLANAILDLYQHPEKREAMAKASFERSKLFDKETYAKNFFAAIENIEK
jgi:glycosyltransferase involved in cell wall biosynthesis